MSLNFGSWIREQREKRGLSQIQLAELAGNEISQSAISQYEREEIKEPSLKNIFIIATALNISISDIPWADMIFTLEKKMGSGNLKKKKFGLYELPTADSVKTFEGKIYELKGFLGIESDTGDIKHVTDLYYQTRTVISNSKVLAKRKNKSEDLLKVSHERKVKVR